MPGSLVLVIVIVFLLFRDSLVSSLSANLGAVIMARTELKNWPTNEWNDSILIPGFEIAEEEFLKSQQLIK